MTTADAAEADRARHADMYAEFDAGVEAMIARLERTADDMLAAAMAAKEKAA